MKVKAKGPFLIISHPEKGSFRLYLMDDRDKGPDYYQADKKLCAHQIYSKGVIIEGEIVTDADTIEKYLQNADDALEALAVNAIESGKRSIDDELRSEALPYLESINFDEAVNECMRARGWTTRMGTKDDLN